MTPRVSVLMPTYKPNAQHLIEAIESVFAQTEQNWTLHIQDEPTEVDTEKIIENYLQDGRVTFERNSERLGIGKNWNACLRTATAPYIQFMFQDDIWSPGILENGIRVLDEHERVGMVSLGHEYKMEGGIPDDEIYREVEEEMSKITQGEHDGQSFLLRWMKQGLRPNIIGEPCFVMLRKAVTDKVGMFHETMQQQLDAEYWTRMLAQSNWYYVPSNLGAFRVHASATTARNTRNKVGLGDRLYILRKSIILLPIHKWPMGFLLFLKHFLKMIQKFISYKCQS